MADKPAETKRVKISKAQKLTLFEVLCASIVVGICIVLANFIIKYINFNKTIITAKNDAITDYDSTLRNVGVCQDKDRNGRLNDAELSSCEPNSTPLENVVGSLRYNVYQKMAENEDLESVARKRNEDVCYDRNGKVIDFSELYDSALTDKERERSLQGAKLCSSLRVISDALPAAKNTEALMSSLNQLFIVTNLEPEALSPSDNLVETEIKGVGVIPVAFSMETDGVTAIRMLDNITRSIREFDITNASVEWMQGGLSVRASANAYYLLENFQAEGKTTVQAKGSRIVKADGTVIQKK